MESNLTAVEWLEQKAKEFAIDLDLLRYFQQAKEIEKQQKIAYKIATPLGHVSNMIEQIPIESVIEEYKCKVINAKESVFWNDCLIIAKFYKKHLTNKI
jgi:hypothetical protein